MANSSCIVINKFRSSEEIELPFCCRGCLVCSSDLLLIVVTFDDSEQLPLLPVLCFCRSALDKPLGAVTGEPQLEEAREPRLPVVADDIFRP